LEELMQTCMECGAQMKTKRENYKYDASGLPGITLMGVSVSRCTRCGEFEVEIPNIEGLHKAIAAAVIQKRERLAPAEIRYLRKFLGLSGADFAEIAGVSAETVSRWEVGKQTMGAIADRFLRLLAMTRQPVNEYPLDFLKDVAQAKPRLTRVEMKTGEGGWHGRRGAPLLEKSA
jgi:putative zinc finger/helix-turn-helix YgiT family protein